MLRTRIAGWPPEKVDSVAAPPDGTLAFAWEDPWIFDGPRSHLAVSRDGGDRWRYLRLPDGCVWIASGSVPLRVMGVGAITFLEGPTAAIVREEARLDWPELPAGYGGGKSIPHETHFLSEHEGLALSVDWHERGLLPPSWDWRGQSRAAASGAFRGRGRARCSAIPTSDTSSPSRSAERSRGSSSPPVLSCAAPGCPRSPRSAGHRVPKRHHDARSTRPLEALRDARGDRLRAAPR